MTDRTKPDRGTLVFGLFFLVPVVLMIVVVNWRASATCRALCEATHGRVAATEPHCVCADSKGIYTPTERSRRVSERPESER